MLFTGKNKTNEQCLAGSCKLDMMLYVPQGVPAPHRPPMHPLNALRNRAVAAAQTEVEHLWLRSSFSLSSPFAFLFEQPAAKLVGLHQVLMLSDCHPHNNTVGAVVDFERFQLFDLESSHHASVTFLQPDTVTVS